MSEPLNNRLSIEGAQVKDDEHVATYTPIPDAEDFRPVRSNLTKSKEKISDEAEEKLLQKEDEAKIITRVDMADAKYVVGDHRNGDAKIELDANKRQFSGLTKEELMKYADDPFWVNLRWSLFVLFWAAWLSMLAGAIVIIVRAPKCAPPQPRTWFEQGPLVDAGESRLEDFEPKLELLKNAEVQGIFIEAPSYEVLDQPNTVEQFKSFFGKAKEYGVKVIVDLTANYVPDTHNWFVKSVNKTEPYTNYFIWRAGVNGEPPNKWVSDLDSPAWKLNEVRNEYYLHQYGEDQPDLDFNNPAVQEHFQNVIKIWMQAGASGVRLNKARTLLVDPSHIETIPNTGKGSDLGAGHTERAFWKQKYTRDLPGLAPLFTRFAEAVTSSVDPTVAGETVFTLEEESAPELFLLKRNVSMLRPVPTAPIELKPDAVAIAKDINDRLGSWPTLQLKSDEDDQEIAEFALLLPAAPVFTVQQLENVDNTTLDSESLSHLVDLRSDPSIQHGQYHVAAVPASNSTDGQLVVCARWKADRTGYLAVYNPTGDELRANLTSVPALPDSLTVHHMSHQVKQYTNYTTHHSEKADNVLVPSKSTLVLSYVPKKAVEE